MRTRGIVVGLASLIFALMIAALPGTAPVEPALAQNAAQAAAGSERVTASEPLAGSWDPFNEFADIAVTPNGKWLLAATDKGLTKMSITRNHIATTGRNRRADAGEILAHPNNRIAYIRDDHRLQVFNITGKKPKLLRALKFREKYVIDVAIRPDGKRLYAILDSGHDTGGLQVLKTGRPSHPKAGTYVQDATLNATVVLPGGNRLIALRRGEDDNRWLSVFDITKLKQGELPLIAERNIVPSDIPQSNFWAGSMLLTPNGKQLYMSMGRYDRSFVARFRVSDLKVRARLPGTGARRPQTRATVMANGGRRVYGLHTLSDDQEAWPGKIVWLDPKLSKRHTLTGVGGPAYDLAMSPGGRTKGLLYSLLDRRKGTQLRVLSIDPH